MTQEHGHLLATCWTSAGDVRPGVTADTSPHSLDERIAAAAAANYAGIGFELADLRETLERGGLPDLKRKLDDAGMVTVEIEFIDDWFVSGDRRRVSDDRRRMVLVIAEELGAHHIKVGGGRATDALDLDHVKAEFDRLAREADEHGTLIALEPGAFSALADLDVAVDVVTSVRSATGGLLLDIWHLYRAGFDYDRLPQIVPRDRLFAVELDDGDSDPLPDLFADTFDRRRLCGEGAFDVVRFVRAVERIGFDGPWGVEDMSIDHRAKPIDQALRDAAAAANSCLRVAGRGKAATGAATHSRGLDLRSPKQLND